MRWRVHFICGEKEVQHVMWLEVQRGKSETADAFRLRVRQELENRARDFLPAAWTLFLRANPVLRKPSILVVFEDVPCDTEFYKGKKLVLTEWSRWVRDSKIMQFLRTKRTRLLAAGLATLVAGFFVVRHVREPSLLSSGRFVPLNDDVGIQLAGECLFDCLLREDNSVVLSFKLRCLESNSGTVSVMEVRDVRGTPQGTPPRLGSALTACARAVDADFMATADSKLATLLARVLDIKPLHDKETRNSFVWTFSGKTFATAPEHPPGINQPCTLPCHVANPVPITDEEMCKSSVIRLTGARIAHLGKGVFGCWRDNKHVWSSGRR
jgi:hypothetical protein